MESSPKLHGDKLGILVAADPGTESFEEALKLASTALGRLQKVYIYFIHQAAKGLNSKAVEELSEQSANLFACSYSIRQHQSECPEFVVQSGLSMLNDLIIGADEFSSFT